VFVCPFAVGTIPACISGQRVLLFAPGFPGTRICPEEGTYARVPAKRDHTGRGCARPWRLVAVIVGYLLAWRFKRTLLRTITSMILAAVTGFVGLVMLWWLIGAVMPFPPPDGLSSIWEPLTFLVIFSVLPFSAFYISAKFIRLARKPANPR
jgi:hypothetical protein